MFTFDWAKRTHKGLRRGILFLVKDTPKNGAEIMDALEGISQGWWRPSPGSVYPLLDSMVKEDLLSQLPDKRYQLTEQGREELELPLMWFGQRRSGTRSVEEVVEEISNYIKYLEDIKQSQKQKLGANATRIRELGEKLVSLGRKQK